MVGRMVEHMVEHMVERTVEHMEEDMEVYRILAEANNCRHSVQKKKKKMNLIFQIYNNKNYFNY